MTMTDDEETSMFDSDLSKVEAWNQIEEMDGDAYYLSEKARDVLIPFSHDVQTEYVQRFEQDYEGAPALAFHHTIQQEQTEAGEAYGIPTVPDWVTILTAEDISAILVEALGGEPGSGLATGTARRSREAHEENLGKLEDLIDLDLAEP